MQFPPDMLRDIRVPESLPEVSREAETWLTSVGQKDEEKVSRRCEGQKINIRHFPRSILMMHDNQ
jgi:hypothetical protein